MATPSHVRFKCEICHQPYKRPKILPCFHSYCEVCLELHISKAKPDTKFQCPFCETNIDIPEGGACSFQTNVYIETTEEEGLKETEAEEVNYSCENCDGEPKPMATSYCEVCEQTVCDECVLLHKKLKTTKDHELDSLKTVNNKRPDYLTCFKHESKVEDYYCLTCEKFVCPSYDYEEHKQHKTEPINVAANIKRNLLIKTWQTSEIFLSSERNLNIISERELDVAKREKEAKDRLQRRSVDMKGEIDAGVKKLESEITIICELEKLKLSQLKRDIEATKEKSVAMKRLVTLASDAEVLRDGNKIMCKIKDINISSLIDIPEVNSVKFEDNCKEFDYESIGYIVNDMKILSRGPMEMKLVSAFCTPEFGGIKCILPCRGGNVWIAEAGTTGLIMFNEHGSKHKKILENFEIEAMAMGKDGALFVSVPKEKFIYKIIENNEARKFCSLSSSPGDLAAFENGNIAVCCNEPPKLVIIDQTGQVTRQYAPRASTFETLHCVAVCKFTGVLAVCAQEVNPFSVTKQMNAGCKKTINSCKAKRRQRYPVRMNTKVSAQPALKPLSIVLPSNSKSSVDAPDVSKAKPTQEVLFGLSAKAPVEPASSLHDFISGSNSKSPMGTPEISKAKSTQFSFGTSTKAAPPIAQNPSGIISVTSSESSTDTLGIPKAKSTQTRSFGAPTNALTRPDLNPFGIISPTSSKSSVDAPEVSQAKPTQECLFGLSAKAPIDPASRLHDFISSTNSKSSMDTPEISKSKLPQYFLGTSIKAATPIAPNPSGIISATISESSGIPKAKPTQALSFGALTQPGLKMFSILSATSTYTAVETTELPKTRTTQDRVFKTSLNTSTQPVSYTFGTISASSSKPSADKADNKNTQMVQFGSTETKGTIFVFDHEGNMLAKINRHVCDLIFDQRGHLLVSRVGGDIDVLDHRGNILACLRPNGGDFLSGTIALDSRNLLWIGESGRINVFKYPEISGAQQDQGQ